MLCCLVLCWFLISGRTKNMKCLTGPQFCYFFNETWVWGDGSSPSKPVQDWQCLRSSIIHNNGLTKFFLSTNICFVTILLFTCKMNPISEIKCEISQCLGLFLEIYRKCYEIHSSSLQTLLILESSNVQSTEPMEIDILKDDTYFCPDKASYWMKLPSSETLTIVGIFVSCGITSIVLVLQTNTQMFNNVPL